MGRLVQQPTPPRADRKHPSRRGRGRLLCPACDDPHRRVGLKQNGLRETRGGSIHFGPWQTVYWWFRRFVRCLLFRTLHDVALMLDRERAGREASPSAGVIDSQSVKAPAAPGGGGYDAAKRVKGRKRHIAVDTDGRLLMVNLTPADVQDAEGAEAIIKTIRQRWPWLKHLSADGAYDRGKLMSAASYRDLVIQIVRKLAGQRGFYVLPRRWVVERSFGWMMRWRRLVRDYEERCDVSEAMIHVSMGSVLLRRISHP